jgi:hypothetical protein
VVAGDDRGDGLGSGWVVREFVSSMTTFAEGGSELSLVGSGISELKAFDGADRQADD